MSRHAPKLLQRLLTVVLTLCTVVVALEVVLRMTREDLEEVVHRSFTPDPARRYKNPSNTFEARRRPDLPSGSFCMYNGLGLRQHREFSVARPPGVIRVGVFGDSFTENIRMPVQYGFTEPLDYLLNRTGVPVEVLNFGTDGYGIDQILMQYMEDTDPLGLDVVVYASTPNDLDEAVANGLFDLDYRGRLIRLPLRERPLYFRVLRKLYVTYFLREQWMQLRYRLGDDPAYAYKLKLFKALVGEMHRIAQEREQVFFAVLIPTDDDHNKMMWEELQDIKVPAMNLSLAFSNKRVSRDKLFFKNDFHWNEEGNKMAAVYMFKAIAPLMKAPYEGNAYIEKVLYEYYSAFDRSVISDAWLAPAPLTEEMLQSIQDRYLQLELNLLLGPPARRSMARERLEQFLKVNPIMRLYAAGMADSFVEAGRHEYARACYGAILAVDDTLRDMLTQHLCMMGERFLELGQDAVAGGYFETVLEHQAENERARQGLGRVVASSHTTPEEH